MNRKEAIRTLLDDETTLTEVLLALGVTQDELNEKYLEDEEVIEEDNEAIENTSGILVNRIQTPDGTIITSRYRHDYVTHDDANGYEYMVDGGQDYLRRNYVKEAPHTELNLYRDASFLDIREGFERGGRGKNLDQPLKYVPLCEMNDFWLINTITYILDHMDIEHDEVDLFVENHSNYPETRKDCILAIEEIFGYYEIFDYHMNHLYLKELKYREENDIYIKDEG